MSKVNEEFLDAVFKDLKFTIDWTGEAISENMASDEDRTKFLLEKIEKTKRLVLQHFQQEQENREEMTKREWYDLSPKERTYTQLEVDRLIREAEDKVADWFDDGLPAGFTYKEWYASYRYSKGLLSKHKEGGTR